MLLVIGLVLLPVGLVTHWAHRTFVDTQRFVEAVSPFADDTEVQQIVAQTLTDSLITQEEAADQVTTWFPDAPAGLVSAIASGVVGAVNQVVDNLLAAEQFSELWAGAARITQETAIKVLSGQGPEQLQIVDGQLVLDLSEAQDQVRDEVSQLGIDLPAPRSAVIPLLDAQSLESAQRLYQFGSPIMQWFFVLPLALIAAGIGLARDRATAVRRTGVGVFLGAAALGVAWWLGLFAAATALDGTPFEPVGQMFYTGFTSYLQRGIVLFAIVGVVVAILGWRWQHAASVTPEADSG